MATTTDEHAPVGAEVVPLALARTIVAAAGSSPETGQRTPAATITRWSRQGNTDLTIGDVAAILRAGEQGQSVRLVDLWLRMVKTDAHLASVLLSRIAPVAAARWELSPGEGPEDTADAARKLRDACEEALRGLGNLEPLFTRLLGGIGPGYAVAEIIWARKRVLGIPGWGLGRIRPVHARRFQFSDEFELGLYDESQAVSKLQAEGFEVEVINGRGGVMARLPAGKYIVHQPPSIDDYPTATGLVHPIARWWWGKQKVVTYWLGGAEVGANPRLIGSTGVKTVPEAAEDLKVGLENLAQDGVILLRDGSKVEIVAGLGESSGRVWSELAKFFDAAMSKAVLGSTLNVEIGEAGGNRAAAESQGETTIDPRKDMDGAQLWATIQDQLFRFVRKYNPHIFLPETPLPVGAFVFAEPPVEVDQALIDSGWLKVDQLLVSRGLPMLGGKAGEAFLPRPADDFGSRPAAPLPTAPGEEPEAPEGLDVAEGEDVQGAALNGAQVTALLDIVGQVVRGELPRQTAIEVIVSAFPIDRAQADRLLGEVGAGFVPTVVEPAEPAQGAPPLAASEEAPVPFALSVRMAMAKSRAMLAGSDATQTSFAWKKASAPKRSGS